MSVSKEAIEAASIVTAIEQTITLIERGSINAKLISALLAECKSALSTLPVAVEVKAHDELLSLIPDEIDIPPMTDRGVAGQVLDVAWPLCGGNHQDADFWSIFSFAVHLTLRVSSPGKDGGQEVAIYHGNGLVDCGDAGHHNIELLKLIPAGTKLYTRPQPAITALVEAAEAGWNACRRQVYLLSEDYTERTHPLKGADTVEGNFYRGQYDVAKSFAKAFSAFEARDCDYFKQIDFSALSASQSTSSVDGQP